jgi:hypothetical protein
MEGLYMQVRLDDLREAFDKLLNEFKMAGQETVDIPVDYYWSIPKETRYTPYQEPTEFTLGQISDDLNEVKRIATGEVSPIYYGLVWLGNVLIAMGEDMGTNR